MDLVISFDDTGSMGSVRQEVRNKLKVLTNNLKSKIPDLRIGIIIHNDYCQPDPIYCLDLTNDFEKVNSFISKKTSGFGGIDGGECYELALHSAIGFDWKSDNRLLILIGDEGPHKVGFVAKNGVKCTLDWKQEAEKLKDLCSVKIFSVQALSSSSVSYFYEEIARITEGRKVDLTQFSHAQFYIEAIAHKVTNSLEEYKNSNNMFKNSFAFQSLFNDLNGGKNKNISQIVNKNILVELSKYQVSEVNHKERIKDFVSKMGIKYKAGKGFYQLVKNETITPNKQIIMISKETGLPIDDQNDCRNMLGILKVDKFKRNSYQANKVFAEYDVYVQSTSYTRNLDPNTKFLYEVEKEY